MRVYLVNDGNGILIVGDSSTSETRPSVYWTYTIMLNHLGQTTEFRGLTSPICAGACFWRQLSGLFEITGAPFPNNYDLYFMIKENRLTLHHSLAPRSLVFVREMLTACSSASANNKKCFVLSTFEPHYSIH